MKNAPNLNNISIIKEFTWDMAHMLAGHDGLCKNLHGHTYKIRVEVSKASGNVEEDTANHEKGMVMDFSSLKRIVQKLIVEPLDHAFMYWRHSTDPLEHQIADLLKKSGRKIAEVDYRPTAEEMAISFMDLLSSHLVEANINVISIELWETPTSFARVTRGAENGA
jgi:6-pyruvoyltetrahydropterin/6-carboxytetrahydropterin synthase